MRVFYRILAGFLVAAAILTIWIAHDLSDRTRHSLRDFDAHEVARLETRMWRSYYDHKSARLFADLVVLLRRQFHLPLWRACAGGFHAARAAVVFQRGRERPDYLQALPDVVAYYRLIAENSTESFSVRQVSEAEVEWWIVHRQRDRHAPGDLAHALAVEQAALYHLPEYEFTTHAQARADAMLLRDRGAEQGGVTEEGWTQIGNLLDRSWTSLHDAVNR